MRMVSAMVRTATLTLALAFVPSAVFGQNAPGYGETGGANRNAARQLYDAAEVDFARGKWDSALQRYQDARKAFSAPTIALRIAQCKEKLLRYTDASEAYVEVVNWKVKDGDPAPFAQAVAEARAANEALKPKIPKVRVFVEPMPKDLKLKIDERPLATSFVGLEADVDPGSHTITAEAPNFVTKTASFKVEEGKSVSVSLTLAAASVSVEPGLAPSAAPDAPGRANPNVPYNNIPGNTTSPTQGTLPPIVLPPPKPKAPAYALILGLQGNATAFVGKVLDAQVAIGGSLGVRLGPVALSGGLQYDGGVNYVSNVKIEGKISALTSTEYVGFWFAGSLGYRWLQKDGGGPTQNATEVKIELGPSIPVSRRLRILITPSIGGGNLIDRGTYALLGFGGAVQWDVVALSKDPPDAPVFPPSTTPAPPVA
jgi:hypothetical protein